MDWLVYPAYGLLPEDHSAVADLIMFETAGYGQPRRRTTAFGWPAPPCGEAGGEHASPTAYNHPGIAPGHDLGRGAWLPGFAVSASIPPMRLSIEGQKVRWVRMCLAFSLCLAECSGLSGQTASLPDLPRLSSDSMLPTVRAAVQKAYDAVVAHPQDASANGQLGMTLHAHNAAEAEVCYRRAHLLEPASFRWAYYLGLIEAVQGKYDEAAATLQLAVCLDPDYLPAELNLGDCLLASGKWEVATELYEAILLKHPDSAYGYYGLGRVQAVRKNLSGAVESFRKACALFPNFGPAHYGLAQTYKRLGNREESLKELTLYDRNETSVPNMSDLLVDEIRALNVNPLEQMRLGMELAQEGRLEEAVAAHEKAVEITPELVGAHVNLISLYGRLGQFANGEKHFQAAVQLDPKHPGSYFNHGLLLASQGKFLEAEEAFRKTLEINPRFPDAHTNLGTMLEAQDKLSEAMGEYRKVLANSPNDSRALFNLGRILVNQENYQEGIQYLLKSITTDDEESKPSYLYALGATYARAGDRKNGLHYLRLAREKAAARGQLKLVESIDEDLQILEAEGTPQ